MNTQLMLDQWEAIEECLDLETRWNAAMRTILRHITALYRNPATTDAEYNDPSVLRATDILRWWRPGADDDDAEWVNSHFDCRSSVEELEGLARTLAVLIRICYLEYK